ncbi:MAG: bifunctional (p)ppGpp synthetase/guanosine-3',5'-bis(diphosphate) 3'-pyrophosphohydrolase [Candidatus Sungbacteria bacterium]|nr:bifunctional (p)ppGpp synthetase/guanosine-3',5'-bis(diphosphate) 3'-pyrophosphohydrolase [Candidatus Sungbacteria bacterium]
MNRKEFFSIANEKLSLNDMWRLKLSQAYWFAKEAHRPQSRDDGERYFEHCRRVALILLETNDSDIPQILSALLHDCIEDCFIPRDIIRDLFGDGIASAVETLSKKTPRYDSSNGSIAEKKRKSDAEYFETLRVSPEWVRAVKLADRLDNLRTLGIWNKKRKQKYIAETMKYLIPMADETHAGLAALLKSECEKISRTFS